MKMRPETLRALLIDRELGELPSETLELLDLWLAEHSEYTREVAKLRTTLEITSRTLASCPELGRPEPKVFSMEKSASFPVPLALAASVLMLLGFSSWIGFRAGHHSANRIPSPEQLEPRSPREANVTKQTGPWAQYALVSAPQGGLTVVRRDLNNR
jgi:hypothetical protein